MARPFLVGVLLATAASAAWWWRTDPGHAISVAIAVLIVTCPCALSLATPAATLAAAGALARRGVLVRRLQALETWPPSTPWCSTRPARSRWTAWR
jgi:Cu2+-exporting ATPase